MLENTEDMEYNLIFQWILHFQNSVVRLSTKHMLSHRSNKYLETITCRHSWFFNYIDMHKDLTSLSNYAQECLIACKPKPIAYYLIAPLKIGQDFNQKTQLNINSWYIYYLTVTIIANIDTHKTLVQSGR